MKAQRLDRVRSRKRLDAATHSRRLEARGPLGTTRSYRCFRNHASASAALGRGRTSHHRVATTADGFGFWVPKAAASLRGMSPRAAATIARH